MLRMRISGDGLLAWSRNVGYVGVALKVAGWSASIIGTLPRKKTSMRRFVAPSCALKDGETKRYEATFYDDASRELAGLAAVPCCLSRPSPADVAARNRAFFQVGIVQVSRHGSTSSALYDLMLASWMASVPKARKVVYSGLLHAVTVLSALVDEGALGDRMAAS